MHRIATPLIGGLVTAMISALFVIPAVYSIWRERELGRVG
jgi:copper/silver efflux system protein